MPIAKNIKYCRKRANLTQEALAQDIGVSKATVISWESKKTAVPVPSVHMVADYFGVDFSEFCDVDLEMLDNTLEGKELVLTKSEAQNILMFRKLPDHIKALIRHVIAVEYQRLFDKEVADDG